MLTNFIKQFTDEEIIDMESVHQVEKRFYLTTHAQAKYLDNPDVTFAGIFLGEIYKKKFKPSFILLDLINKHTDKKVQVNDKAAWLYVCGRDILDYDADFPDRTIVLVTTEQDEVLGYGMFWDGPVSVKNLLDRGDFLRKER